MNTDDTITIIRQQTGRFDRRFSVGPAQWPHYDLLWIHEGAVLLHVADMVPPLHLAAPDGVVLFPDIPFRGAVIDGFADASICHFAGGPLEARRGDQEFARPNRGMAYHVQHLMRLSLSYAHDNSSLAVRQRLLQSILDCFDGGHTARADSDRIAHAWSLAGNRLDTIRTLHDVADLIGMSESAFRAAHRTATGTAAGHFLRDLRLREAERLLSSTGNTVGSISTQVGYGHAESFSYAFKAYNGRTPRQFRLWSRQFA